MPIIKSLGTIYGMNESGEELAIFVEKSGKSIRLIHNGYTHVVHPGNVGNGDIGWRVEAMIVFRLTDPISFESISTL